MFIIVFAFRLRVKKSILTAAMVNMWLTFLKWSDLESQTDKCNALLNSGVAKNFQILSLLVLTYLTLLSLSISNADNSGKALLVGKEKDTEANAEL